MLPSATTPTIRARAWLGTRNTRGCYGVRARGLLAPLPAGARRQQERCEEAQPHGPRTPAHSHPPFAAGVQTCPRSLHRAPLVPIPRLGEIWHRRGALGDSGEPAAAEEARLVAPDVLERVDDTRAELRPGVAAELLERGVDASGAAVRAVARQRIEGVGDEDDPRGEGDLLGGEAVGIAGSVDPLVAPAGDLEHDRRQVGLL